MSGWDMLYGKDGQQPNRAQRRAQDRQYAPIMRAQRRALARQRAQRTPSQPRDDD